jgi:hypothetical protein
MKGRLKVCPMMLADSYSSRYLSFLKKPYLHAVAIALSIFGFAFMGTDYFLKERSAIYYKQTINYTQKSQ